MSDEIIAAYPEAYALGLRAVGLLERVSDRAGVVATAHASVASDIAADRLAAIQAEVRADTARLMEGVYKRVN